MWDVYYRDAANPSGPLLKWSGRAASRSQAISFAPCARSAVRHVYKRPTVKTVEA